MMTAEERSETTGQQRNSSPATRRVGTLGLVSWTMYDWANQAFATLIHTFVFSVYFSQQVAGSQATGTAQWGTAISLAAVFVAIAGPVLGAMADQGGQRKPWILAFTLLCVSATALLWFVEPSTGFIWLALILVGLATIGSELSFAFYNSLLPRIAPQDRLGRWSGWSWGIGFAGGLASLIIALFAFIRPEGAWLGLDPNAGEHVRATALFVAGWYLVFALPLFFFTPDVPASGKTLSRMARDGLGQLWHMLRELRQHGPIVRFLVAHLIYIDGLATLFAFGGIYAAGTFGMKGEMVLAFGIALNVAAGLGAFAFAWIDDRIGSKATILLSLIGLIIPGTLILLVQSTVLFWIFALLLGLFIGPAQASGRSLLAHMAPEDLQAQMFGFFALSGKGTAFFGPLLVGWITYLAGSQRIGMGTIVIFFAIGFLIVLTVPATKARAERAGRLS